MTAHLTEEEQIETFKRWWRENGKSTVIGVVLAVVGYFGWNGWQAQQQQQAEVASESYQQMVDVIQANSGDVFDDAQAATVKHLATSLKNDFSDTLYASQAALFLAKLAVQANDFNTATTELQWVLSAKAGTDIELVARGRLARIKFAQQDFNGALALLNTEGQGVFKSSFAEIRGDILLAQGDDTSARAAYQLALGALTSGQQSRRQLLQIKLKDLQSAPATVEESRS